MATHSTALLDSSVPFPPSSDPDSGSTQLLLEGYLRRDDLAQQLGVSARTLDRWHTLRYGPPRVAIGRTILYNLDSVRDWLRSHEYTEGTRPQRRRSRRNCN